VVRGQPTVTTDDPQGVKSDYNLVERIGTRGAWEVFLAHYPSGLIGHGSAGACNQVTTADIPVDSTSFD
jgi:hypothetical protein